MGSEMCIRDREGSVLLCCGCAGSSAARARSSVTSSPRWSVASELVCRARSTKALPLLPQHGQLHDVLAGQNVHARIPSTHLVRGGRGYRGLDARGVEDDGGRLVLQSHCGVTGSDRLELATQCGQPSAASVARSRPDTTAAVTPPSAAAPRKASRPPGTALP